MGATTPSGGASKVDEKLLLDWGARIGVAAFKENVKAAQLENLIASLDSVQGREALLATVAFALRQARRQKIGKETAELVRRALLELYEKGAARTMQERCWTSRNGFTERTSRPRPRRSS